MTDSGDQTTWTFSYNVPATSDGTATVTIAGATDAAGNSNDAASNNSFTIDNTGPTVALTYSPDRAVSSADTLTITATFNEPIEGTPTIAINTTGTDLSATNMTDSGGQTTWTFSYDVPATSDGTATVTISGAADAAANSNEASNNNSFTIDNTGPTVALTYSPDRAVSSADTLAITATFSQGMSASPQISIANSTGDSIQAATNMTGSAGDTVWTFNFTVPDGNSGDATVTIAGTDIAGNSNEASTNNSFTIDNTGPTVALTYSPDRAVSSADTLAITATFSQGMSASPQISIANSTGDSIQAATNMTGSAGDTVWTFNFTVPDGNSGDATVTIAGTDIAGNSNEASTNNSFTIDNTGPTVALTYSPDRAVSSADTLAITTTFSEAIVGTPTITIDTTGTDLSATNMTDSGDQTTWTFSYDVPATSDGTATVTISGSTDAAANPNAAASNNSFTIDNTGPTVALTYSPDRAVSSADELTITATFSEAIVGTPNIAINTTGTDLGATNMTDSGDQTSWTFSFDVPATSDGTATVTIAGATDAAGNPNEAPTNNTFTIDNIGPTVAVTYSPDRAVSSADTLTITATFNEAVVGTPTIAIDTTGVDFSATAMTDSGDQTSWTFSYEVPATSDGTATVTIAGATDAAGNPNEAPTNNTFTIDNTGPTVALTYSPDRAVSSADELTITATFSEAINGTPTIAINTTGTDLSATNMADSGDQTTWTFSYDVPATSDGTATVTIAGAADAAANPNDAATNNTFTIDNTGPTVALTYHPDRAVSSADELTITATFNDAIVGTPTIAIDTSGTDLSATNMTDSGDQTTWTFNYDVPATSDGTATVTIAGAADPAGNSNDAATNNTFTIDNTGPTVALTYGPDRAVSSADTLTITATFNEAIVGTPTIAIDTAGVDLAATAMTDSGDQITWTFIYDVPATSDGTVTVTIAGATDAAGNPNEAPTNNTFTIDNTGPTVAITYSPDRAVSSADELTITATFNEAIVGTPTITIDTTGVDLSATNMTDSGDQTTWTFRYDVPSTSDGTTTVTIAGATDAAANPNDTATNNSFTIDNTGPTVALRYSPDRAVSSADELTITATFNEAIVGTPTITIDTTGVDLSATNMTDSGDQTTWTFSYDVPSTSDGTTTVTIAGATDAAANPNDTATNNSFTIDDTGPTVALRYSPDRAVSSADELTITATFNEAIVGTPTITIDTTGVDLSATNMTDSGDQTTWTFSYDVPSTSDGTATVTISGATDAAGNANDTASNNSFNIDNTGPTVALTYSPDRAVSSIDTLTIKATFNEAIVGIPSIAINMPGVDLSATEMTDSGDQTTWTFDYDVPSASDGIATVTISGATDSIGNPNDVASNNSFTIDNTGPSVALTYSPDRAVSSIDTLTIKATFNEAIVGTPSIAINTPGVDLSATEMTESGDQTTWTFDYDVPSASDGIATVTISGATDAIGNPNDVASNNSFTINNRVADLSVAKVDSPDPALLGEELTYALTVINNGPYTGTAVTLTDTLPAAANFASASAGCTEAGGTVTCTLGTMASGDSVTVSIVVRPTVVSTITNTASVSSGVADPSTGDNTATETTTVNPAADLSVTKADFPGPGIVAQ